MSFDIKNFATIRMCVSNVQKSRDWYKAFFGFEPIEDQKDFVSFKIGNTTFDIVVADQKNPLSQGGSVGYWLVDDLDEALLKAKSLGSQVYRGPLEVKEINRTIVQILDPYGNVFGLEAELL